MLFKLKYMCNFKKLKICSIIRSKIIYELVRSITSLIYNITFAPVEDDLSSTFVKQVRANLSLRWCAISTPSYI